MTVLALPALPPKAELWCRTLLQFATSGTFVASFQGFPLCSVRTPLRRVKSEDWNIGSESFWKDLQDESHSTDFCDSDISDGDEVASIIDDMESNVLPEDVFMRKKQSPIIWKSKRKAKRYLKSRSLRRAHAFAERSVQRIELENALDAIPLWRQHEMPMRVFFGCGNGRQAQTSCFRW